MDIVSEVLGQIMHWLDAHGRILLQGGVEVFLIFLMVYVCLRLLQGTRAVGILRGLGVVYLSVALLTVVITRLFKLEAVSWVLSTLPAVLIPVFILFQPEIRRALVQLGQNPLFSMLFRPHAHFADELVKATFSLARDKTGALIAIERQDGLSSYVERGVRLDSEVSAELIRTIFWPGTPLHDGAVVIRQQRIVAAGCLFPLTDNPHFSAEVGTRHRAGIGITEESDAVAIIVSEETGRVSLAVKGTIQQGLDEKALRRALEDIAAEAPVT